MAQDLGAGEFLKNPYLMETIGLAVRQELDKKERHIQQYYWLSMIPSDAAMCDFVTRIISYVF
ncbi:MAG: hypothetical protein WCJ37_09325 [Syntrophus sp. (in: bacteria)]